MFRVKRLIMILLLTHSGDYFTIDKVCESLAKRGADFFRVNTDQIPVIYPMSGEWTEGGAGKISLYLDEQVVDLSPENVSAVWARRMWPSHFPPDCPPEVVRQCAEGASSFVAQSLDLLEDAYWINPTAEGKRAESKLLQLRVANELGFQVPPTLVSNHAEKVREFFHQQDGDIITKLLVPQVVSMEANAGFAYTCRVEEAHLEHVEQIRGMPQIFQRFVKKKREFRVVMIGERVFCGALNIPEEGPLALDWRQATQEDHMDWSEASLPTEIEAKMRAMLDELGLVFGVFDFAETDAGEIIFFEVNQAGEWGMLEHYLGLPIAEAIADELISH